MSDKFLNGAGLNELRNWINNKLATKQDTLVSGTNIKTINSQSLLGSGNIVTPGEDNVITSIQRNGVTQTITNKTVNIHTPNVRASTESGFSDLIIEGSDEANALTVKTNSIDLTKLTFIQKINGTETAFLIPSINHLASDSVAGLVKTNSTEGITLNESGQLDINGRLGQTAQGGLFYPLTSIPKQGNTNSLLLSEAVGLSIGSRSMSIAGGTNVTLKVTAAAGATTYEISNTQNNRFICACWTGGRLAISQAEAAEKTVAVTSVKFANGNNVTPYFGATEANNNIIVTVDETLNPNSTLTTVRGYGAWMSTDTLSVGQGNSSVAGKALLVGQSLYINSGGQNQIAMIGNRMYTTKGSCIVVGADNINASQFGAVFGEGHDTTGAPSGVAVFGRYSSINSNTLMAVGNGTSAARTNAFEVLSDGIVLKSPNGTRYKITVSDTGAVTTTKL